MRKCTFHDTGGFCSHACPRCDDRMLSRAELARARREAQLAILMRQPPAAGMAVAR